jgi:hypothetical protein
MIQSASVARIAIEPLWRAVQRLGEGLFRQRRRVALVVGRPQPITKPKGNKHPQTTDEESSPSVDALVQPG